MHKDVTDTIDLQKIATEFIGDSEHRLKFLENSNSYNLRMYLVTLVIIFHVVQSVHNLYHVASYAYDL